MTTHAELVEAVAALIEPHIIADNAESLSASILALIAERLREPSRRMAVAGDDAIVGEYYAHREWDEAKDIAENLEPKIIWRAMLDVSPLYPSKKGNEE